MNYFKKALIVVFFLPVLVFGQMYSTKDIINQYDPFLITINDVKLSTNDDEFRERANFVIIMTITIGNEKIIKFLRQDDFTINNVKSYGDDFWQYNMTVRKNNSVLIPSLYNLPNNTNSINIKFEGFTNLSAGDIMTLDQLSTGFVYVSSTMLVPMEQAYKYIASSPDVNRPNSGVLTTAEVLQQNVRTRAGVMYVGNPIEVNYVIPPDPKKAFGSNILIQGKISPESVIKSNIKDQVNLTITKYTDVKIVHAEPFYLKIKGVFQDLTSQTIIPNLRSESYIAKAQEIISEDLVVGLKQGVYLNDQVVKQYTNLMNLLKAGVRAKSDSLESTSDIMKSDEREALSYFETALKENDYNLDTQYLYDEFINSSVNRGILQREIDKIRRYYQIK
ncbi:MAG TPA: hypothetical protein VGK25_14315 [Ignavibacteria bacterium]|jgi:hypothetical protein